MIPQRRRPETGPDAPAINLPPGVLILCVVIVAVHAILNIVDDQTRREAWAALGFIPLRLTVEADEIGSLATLLSYQALHGSWLHLGVNTLALAAFGAAVERMAGAPRMILLGLGSGVAGALAQWAMDTEALALLIGASGMTSGLFGAAIIGIQRFSGGRGLWPLAIVWIGVAALSGQMGAPGGGVVAWIAHVGGFVFGLAGGLLLFGRPPAK